MIGQTGTMFLETGFTDKVMTYLDVIPSFSSGAVSLRC
jgi:hypothetical protein